MLRPEAQVAILQSTPTNTTVDCVSKRSLIHGGFTLVEVLAAVVLLSVGLLGVLAAGQAARQTEQRAVNMSSGRIIAQSILDLARAAPYNSIASLAGSSSDPSLPRGNNVSVAVNNYTNPAGQTDPDLKQVTVTVTWPEQETVQTIVYETLIAKPD